MTGLEGNDTARLTQFEFIEVSLRDSELLDEIARMHVEYLPFGAMSGLGKSFARRIGYVAPIEEGVMRVVAVRADGETAGYVAFSDSLAFRDQVFGNRPRIILAVLRALLKDPRRLVSLYGSIRIVGDLGRSAARPSGKMGEITAIVVKPRFASAEFVRNTGRRLSEELLQYAIAQLRKQGVEKIRGLVDAFNKPMLFLYARLGANLKPMRQAGREMVEVWLDTRVLD